MGEGNSISFAQQKCLQQLVNAVAGYAAIVDNSYRWIAFNEEYAEEHEALFGIRPEVGQSLKEFLPESDERQRVLNIWERALCGEKFIEVLEYGEFDLKRKFFRMTLGPLKNEQEDIYAGFMIAHEVPSTSTFEEKLAAEVERFDRLFSYAPIGMVLVSKEGRFLRTNRTLCQIWGYSPQELSKLSYRDITHPDDIEKGDRLMASLAGGDLQNFELEKRYIDKDGNTIWAQVSVSKMPDREGAPLFYIAQVKDITDSKQIEKMLLETKNAALASDRAKSNFLAAMSHEIRTPMNAVLGFSQILELSSLDDEQQLWLQHIRIAGQHLLELIDSILNYSRIDSGKVDFEQSEIILDEFIEDTLSILQNKAVSKSLEFGWSADGPIPLVFVGDAGRLRQILINLLGNAIKFTKEGNVHLRVGLHEIGDDIESLIFSVEDTGVGLEEEALDRIFLPFGQAEHTTSHEYGGTGLGLAISSKLAESMAGAISVSSKPGKGSVFTLSIPYLRPDHDQTSSDDSGKSSLFGLNALLVENLLEEKRSIKANLIKLGMHAKTAETVKETWSLMLEGNKFDVLIIDLDMPGEDITTFIRELEEELKDFCPKKILLRYHKKRETTLPFEPFSSCAVIDKPVAIEDLRNALSTLLFSREKNKKALEREKAIQQYSNFASRYPAKILVVEDKPSNEILIKLFLERLGYHGIEIVEDGNSCIKTFRNKPIDVILMDIQLPVMDGIDTAREILEIEKIQGGAKSRGGQGVGIIGISASTLRKERDRCLSAGMHAFLSKPIQLSSLQRALQELIGEPD